MQAVAVEPGLAHPAAGEARRSGVFFSNPDGIARDLTKLDPVYGIGFRDCCPEYEHEVMNARRRRGDKRY